VEICIRYRRHLERPQLKKDLIRFISRFSIFLVYNTKFTLPIPKNYVIGIKLGPFPLTNLLRYAVCADLVQRFDVTDLGIISEMIPELASTIPLHPCTLNV